MVTTRDCTVLINDRRHPGALLQFRDAVEIIEASSAEQVSGAMAAAADALACGWHLAGFFAYELGALSSGGRINACFPSPGPLLWLGAFDAPQRVDRDDLYCTRRHYAGPLRHEWTQDQYLSRFNIAMDHIAAGDTYQVNLSLRSSFSFVGEPLSLYLALWDAARAPYAAYIDTGLQQILSLSPELFFAVEGDEIVVQPMKGTAARSDDPRADAAGRALLAASEKNRAENVMIVDLMRNDLGRIAVPGSIHVEDLFHVDTYSTLHTMVSTVSAKVRPGVQFVEQLGALFPPGSVVGAPKLRAMQVISDLEVSPRGVYCGAIGHVSPGGASTFNVAIRTITIARGMGTLGIGGAVVADSSAHAEYDECLLKAKWFECARAPLTLIETFRWAGRFRYLEDHLERMEASAHTFGIPFDREAALEALSTSVADHREILRVRLELHENGECSCLVSPMKSRKPTWSFTISDRIVDSGDIFLRHKTCSRRLYDEEWQRVARERLADEVVFVNERGELTEGTRTTLFVRRHGVLMTPPVSSGLLDGVLRRRLVSSGRCREAVLTIHDLPSSDEIYLGNSIYGLMRATCLSLPV